ncbi:uncharacterized protein [Littorina saxatilis]|uniref:uncharacterized protein n=1 Tax=Littorina saxatilis TaxID=31220 RepID=UPI0038B49157
MDIFRMLILLAFVVQSAGAQQGEKWTTKISYMIVDDAACKVGCKGLIPYDSANQSLRPFYEGCMGDTLLRTSENTCLLQTDIQVTKTMVYVEERLGRCRAMQQWSETARVSSFERTGKLNESGILEQEMMSLPVDCPASNAHLVTCTLRLEGEITLDPNCLQEHSRDPCKAFSIDGRQAVLKRSSQNHWPQVYNCKCTMTAKKPQAFDIQVLNLESRETKVREEETTVNFVRIWDTVANEYWEEGIQLYPSMHGLEHVRSLDIRFVKNGNSDVLQILTIQAPSPFTLQCGEVREVEPESMVGVGMTIFLLIVLIAVTLFVFYWQRQDPPRAGYSEDFARPTSMMSLIDHGQPEPVVLYQNTSSLDNTFQLEGSMPDLTIDRRRSQQMSRLSRTYSSPNLP